MLQMCVSFSVVPGIYIVTLRGVVVIVAFVVTMTKVMELVETVTVFKWWK